MTDEIRNPETSNPETSNPETGTTETGRPGWLRSRKVAVAVGAGTLVALTATGAAASGVMTGWGEDGPAAQAESVLEELVADGTLEEQQAEAVLDGLTERHEQLREQLAEHREEAMAERDALLQDVLGLSAEEVRERLAGGETMADIAGDSLDELVAAVVAQRSERVQEAVDAGRLTQEQADTIVEGMPERVATELEQDRSELAGRGPGGGHGFGGPDGEHGFGGPGFGGPGFGGPGFGGPGPESAEDRAASGSDA